MRNFQWNCGYFVPRWFKQILLVLLVKFFQNIRGHFFLSFVDKTGTKNETLATPTSCWWTWSRLLLAKVFFSRADWHFCDNFWASRISRNCFKTTHGSISSCLTHNCLLFKSTNLILSKSTFVVVCQFRVRSSAQLWCQLTKYSPKMMTSRFFLWPERKLTRSIQTTIKEHEIIVTKSVKFQNSVGVIKDSKKSKNVCYDHL